MLTFGLFFILYFIKLSAANGFCCMLFFLISCLPISGSADAGFNLRDTLVCGLGFMLESKQHSFSPAWQLFSLPPSTVLCLNTVLAVCVGPGLVVFQAITCLTFQFDGTTLLFSNADFVAPVF